MIKVGDWVRRVNGDNGGYAKLGQIASVTAADANYLTVAYQGMKSANEGWYKNVDITQIEKAA